ncbi:MAG: proton-conducting transporter membrane subunit [Bacteroidota bacterium]
MLSGFLFKMAAAPFHLWAPDVYESTPAPIVAFLSVAPKLAALYVVIHWMSIPWEGAIAVIALFTIIVGTLAALNQTNSKRMMAWSSVAQAGFLLIIPATNLSPLVYYAVVFAIMNYVVFIVIHQQEQSGRGTSYSDFNGIGYTNPLAAVAITLGLMSLVGIPPVAGFMTKLFVFSNAWSKYANSTSPIFLALFIIGLLTTVASLFFYLKIPFYAFFRRSEEIQPLKISLVTNLLLIILVGTLLALFFAPGLLMAD